MIALGLLASHLVGDFVFQTRWQANGKLDDARLRARHVVAYTIPFALWTPFLDVPLWRLLLFNVLLSGLHFATDSRRFYSTIGDVIGWKLGARYEERERHSDLYDMTLRDLGSMPPANPWPAIPMMVDQTLHLVQLAALGWLLA